MVNIIDAIINLLQNPIIKLNQSYINERNRANNMGDALEEYVKDLFAGTVNEQDSSARTEKQKKAFSYLGNQKNPPDFIIRGGDAVEVKKIESPNSALALNSSYPKQNLYADSPLITNNCRACEEWTEKDIIYTVGVVNANTNTLSSLIFVYGSDYAADHEAYERIRQKIKCGILEIPDVEFNETNELGRINYVDPLGITFLRVRGMWGINNPFKVFEYVEQRDPNAAFNFIAIINEKKWKSLDRTDKLIELIGKTDNANLKLVDIKQPDNPTQLKKAVLITFRIYQES
ncbi:NgoPII restriction endonuclease [Oligella urethralis]|uniref:NgoPII family restriction endonuclease n=1 Tax=Oligella urethralis TaxID=90245 RepID=UPI000E06AAB0|nr:NgoPII family restriction endonuclease [Oligella urethralis]SUA94296.1 NgoPII restriction endonuclease [Oligella urethralis]